MANGGHRLTFSNCVRLVRVQQPQICRQNLLLCLKFQDKNGGRKMGMKDGTLSSHCPWGLAQALAYSRCSMNAGCIHDSADSGAMIWPEVSVRVREAGAGSPQKRQDRARPTGIWAASPQQLRLHRGQGCWPWVLRRRVPSKVHSLPTF